MPGKVEAFGLLLVLLPGFLCAYVVQSLAVRCQQTEADKVIEALISASCFTWQRYDGSGIRFLCPGTNCPPAATHS